MRLVPVLLLAIAGAATAVNDPKPHDKGDLNGTKPHILFALVDDLGHFNVELTNPEIRTPHLVELRKQGLFLDRHYTYKYCSPTRVSLMSGRLPIHVKEDNDWLGGIPRNMTILAAKLKTVGYATHKIGKWHAGALTHEHLPFGRGFDSDLGYLHCCEDHFKQVVEGFTDYWKDDAPAFGMNGTGYCTYNYVAEAKRVLASHDPKTPIYMYMAFHNNHGPLQVVPYYKRHYKTGPDMIGSRATYNGMTTAWDDGLKNITDTFKAKKMWENTLLIWTTDNGGPIYGTGGANNYPLRGGKMAHWEGGIRTLAMIGGGFLPKRLWGMRAPGYIHICDWYATLAYVAGVDPTDHKAAAAGIPPIDSINQWPYIFGLEERKEGGEHVDVHAFDASAPRTIIPLGTTTRYADDECGGIIVGPIKLLVGPRICEDIFTGKIYPNQTWGFDAEMDKEWISLDEDVDGGRPPDQGNPRVQCGNCSLGCMFNISSDPNEHHDLALDPQHAVLLKTMMTAFDVHVTQTVWTHTDIPEENTNLTKAKIQARLNGGYWGPYLNVTSAVARGAEV